MVVVLPSLQAIRNDAEYSVLLAAVLGATAGHPAHHALVRVAAGHTRPADALSLLESDSQRCEAWLYAGRFLESEGRIPDAIAAYEACIAVDPDAGESKIARSAVQLLHEHGETAAGDAGSRANALVRQAEALLAHGDARSAASLLEDAMRIHATHSGEQTVGYASLLAWLAKARAAEGSFDTAEELSRRAVALATAVADGSVQVWALGGLGEIQRARGRVDEAESAFRRAVEIAASACGRESPLCIDATFKLARLLYGVWESNRGDRELAEASRLNAELVPLLRALAGERSVQHGDALFNLALCRKDSGANEDALALLDRAAQVYAVLGHGYVVQRARCHGARSAVLRQLDRPADAGEALQRALEVLKDSERPEPALRSELLQALADVFDSQGRVLDSIPLLEEAAALQVATTREGRTAWARLALAHHRRGDFARARPLYGLAFGLPAGDESAPDREDVDAR
jgi:tetratricopeptide (TPR) repeat protein